MNTISIADVIDNLSNRSRGWSTSIVTVRSTDLAMLLEVVRDAIELVAQKPETKDQLAVAAALRLFAGDQVVAMRAHVSTLANLGVTKINCECKNESCACGGKCERPMGTSAHVDEWDAHGTAQCFRCETWTKLAHEVL